MDHIDTTLTKIRKIKLLANQIKKTKDIQLSKALEEVSRDFGYDNYDHINYCLKNTKRNGSTTTP
jgi:hypothetical protein